MPYYCFVLRNGTADQCLYFLATQIVQSLLILNPKFKNSRYHLWLFSPVCVGNPEDRFSHNEAYMYIRLIHGVVVKLHSGLFRQSDGTLNVRPRFYMI